jgi:hypothetical protein
MKNDVCILNFATLERWWLQCMNWYKQHLKMQEWAKHKLLGGSIILKENKWLSKVKNGQELLNQQKQCTGGSNVWFSMRWKKSNYKYLWNDWRSRNFFYDSRQVTVTEDLGMGHVTAKLVYNCWHGSRKKFHICGLQLAWMCKKQR